MKIIYSFILVAVLLLSIPQLSLAQGSNSGLSGGSNSGLSGGSNKGGIKNPLNGNADLAAFLKSILRLVFLIGTMVVVFFIILSGFKYVTAQGNPAKITEANRMLLYTAIGAAILLGAQTIADVIYNTVRQLGA